MDIQCSPVNYTRNNPPQVIVMAMLKESNLVCPQLVISSKAHQTLTIRLPIYANKVVENVDQMNDQVFKKNWDDISFNRPQTFTKLDTIIKNPAPSHIPVSTVLKQISNFLGASFNMTNVATHSDVRMIVRAAGQACFKPQTQSGFPQNPAEMAPANLVPVMVEAEFYSEDTSAFRLSIRAAPSKNFAVALVNLLKLFMFPNE